MKLNRNFIVSIIILSSLLCFSYSWAAPVRKYNQIDMANIEKIRKQLIKQGPILKERDNQDKIRRQSGSLVTARKNAAKSNVNRIKKQLNKDTGNIRIFINTSDDVYSLSDELKTYGVRIIRIQNNRIAVEAPVESLEKIFNEVESIDKFSLPPRFFPQAVESEGLAVTDSDDFHTLDYYGAGVKIAVMDVGFIGLTEAQQNGDLPGNVVAYDFTGNGLETEYVHGTACAEIVYDMAPQAEFYLLKVSTSLDMLDAIDYCVDNSIDIISMSIGTYGTGPGNGMGPLDEYFNVARLNGILVIAAAGNNGNMNVGGRTVGFHWKGMFSDSNTDNYHEFIEGDPDIYFNIFSAYPTTNDDGDPEDGEVSVLLRWNDWIYVDIDYDLVLYEYDPETEEIEEIARSDDLQNGSQSSYQVPVEYISLDIPDYEDYTHYYAIAVVKTGGTEDAEMELHLGMTSMFEPFNGGTGLIATSSSSLTEPADAESVMAVGVIDYMDWTTGPQEDFSSQGPTNAWAGSSARIKPDIMGPDGVTTFTYGSQPFDGFYGASAATPHVAGLAALILSKYPGMTPNQLQYSIESNAVDMGASGKDNIYGWGRIKAVTNLSGGGGGGGCFISSAAFGALTSHFGFVAALSFITILSILIAMVVYAIKRKSNLYRE